eukprot:1499845-Pleurochrysis_carterae.AAC.1
MIRRTNCMGHQLMMDGTRIWRVLSAHSWTCLPCWFDCLRCRAPRLLSLPAIRRDCVLSTATSLHIDDSVIILKPRLLGTASL